METINEINQILDCPKSYLIQYYDDLKTKVDIEYVTKLRFIQDIELKEETTKKWIKIIDIIETCLAKCIKNVIPNDLIISTKETLNKTEEIVENKLEIIKAHLQSYLFSNDSYVAIWIPMRQQIFIGNEEMNLKEIK